MNPIERIQNARNLPTYTRSNARHKGQQVYFEGSKRSELTDLKQYFKGILSDPNKLYYRKEVIKKIILYTTQGIDTSRLYAEMVLASATKDLIEKNKENPNFTWMAINTYIKDTNSPNPNIRSLVIRHLSNLYFKDKDKYITPTLEKGLQDSSTLVKRSSIMGFLKIIREKNRLQKQKQIETNEQLLNTLYSMIRNNDTGTISALLLAINQIEIDGISMSHKLTWFLLSKLDEFEQFQLSLIFEYIELYEPKNDDEINHILKQINPKLNSSLLSTRLAIGKIILNYTNIKPSLLPQIIIAIYNSLLSFINSDCSEIQWVALKHILYLLHQIKYRNIIQPKLNQFCISSTELTYIKIIKIQLIQYCTTKDNISDIVVELTQRLKDDDIIQNVIAALQRIMMNSLYSQAKLIINTILQNMKELNKQSLSNCAILIVRNYLRKYPQEYLILKEYFYHLAANVSENESKCALIEIIGDYGEYIQDSIELIAWNQTEQLSNDVQISLLRSNVKLFFKRPIQMLNMLSRMFQNIFTSDQIHINVKDYAAYLYRGLQNDIEGFKILFMQNRLTTNKIINPMENQLNFNSLEIIYQKLTYKWLLDKNKFLDQIQQYDYQAIVQEFDIKEQIDVKIENKFVKLQFDDFIEAELDSNQFEHYWQQLEIGSSITRMVNNVDILSQSNMQSLFTIWGISVMASAETQQEIKLYLYCKINIKNGLIACMQFEIQKLSDTLTLVIKGQDQQLAGFISKYIEDFLKINQII